MRGDELCEHAGRVHSSRRKSTVWYPSIGLSVVCLSCFFSIVKAVRSQRTFHPFCPTDDAPVSADHGNLCIIRAAGASAGRWRAILMNAGQAVITVHTDRHERFFISLHGCWLHASTPIYGDVSVSGPT